MNRKIKLWALVTTGLCFAGTCVPAMAQDNPDADTGTTNSNEIVVTAQKREERLLDVPVAVSAVSADSLVSQNLVSIRDFYTRIPGIQLSGNTTQDISLRGINTGGGTNPTVAILIDDVQFGSSTYLGRPPIPDIDPATLQRVEVLRGPQGTLYGASSLGGLIKYVTKDPSTSDFSGRIEFGANTVRNGDEGWSVRGSINAPIVDNRIGVSISGFYRDDPGYVDNIIPDGSTVADANKNKVYGGRAALLLRPFDNLTVTLSALYQKQKLEGTANIPVCPSCSTAAGTSTPIVFDPRGVPDLRTARSAIVPTVNELQLYTGRVELDLDPVLITSITAWGRSDQVNTTDSTARFGPPLLEAFGIYPAGGTYLFGQPILTNKFTQELRFSSQGDTFDWLGGFFYTNERSSIAQTINRTGNAPNVLVYSGSNLSTYEEKAVFGDVTWHASDRFDIQIGGRYANNAQDYRVLSVIDVPAQPIFGPGEDHLFTSEENSFTWLITPSYKFTPDLMGYIRIASGYRPGGPNTETPGAAPTFESDDVINYEVGLKGSLFDRRMTFDIAAFQIDWNNVQLQNTALPSQFVFFENGKGARSRGIEVQTNATLWEGFTVDANATFLDAVLTGTLDPSVAPAPGVPGVQRLRGVDGDRLPYSAKFTGNLSAQQSFQVANNAEAFVGFTVSHLGNRFGLFNQNSPAAVLPRLKLPSYTTVDLRAGLAIDDQWKLNLYVRNLFDKRGITSGDTRNGTQLPQVVFITPRVIGFSVSADF